MENVINKICHVTSAHSSNDTRIFHKQCKSLKKYGYEVSLVAPGEDNNNEGINIVGMGEKPNNRFVRFLTYGYKTYKKALSLNSDVYHMHDPELLPYALLLKMKRKKVIFDSHEDYVSTLKEKKWIPKYLRKIVLSSYKILENKVISSIDGAIVCYHWTEERYSNLNDNVKMILNYPIIGPHIIQVYHDVNSSNIAFAGGVSKQWNHNVVLNTLTSMPDLKYKLAGGGSKRYLETLKNHEGWDQVEYFGKLPFENVYDSIYKDSFAGIALLDYIEQCKKTIGNLSNTKFFEIMYLGLPIVCTDFKLWKEIVDEEECGICVNSHDSKALENAFLFLKENPKEAIKMGENGKKAIIEKYNWAIEEKKLISLYEQVINLKN